MFRIMTAQILNFFYASMEVAISIFFSHDFHLQHIVGKYAALNLLVFETSKVNSTLKKIILIVTLGYQMI